VRDILGQDFPIRRQKGDVVVYQFQIRGLEEGEEHRKPLPRWVRFALLPVVFAFMLLLWPLVLYSEIRS
jgi:hypothetical protein